MRASAQGESYFLGLGLLLGVRASAQGHSCGSNILPQRSSCAFIMQPQRSFSRTQAQVTRNQPQEELLLADAERSSCACIIFGLYCKVANVHNQVLF